MFGRHCWHLLRVAAAPVARAAAVVAHEFRWHYTREALTREEWSLRHDAVDDEGFPRIVYAKPPRP